MSRLRGYLATSLWALPGAMLLLSVAGAIASTLLDRVLTDDVRWIGWLFFTGSPEAAREIFSAIAGSMLTITGVVFSITMLVLQLASTQFSPRTLRTFLRDVPSKVALGTFVGTFAYALIGLSTVRSTDDLEFVPRLTVTLAFFFVLTSLAMFLHYIHHTAQRIQVTSIIKSIGEETIAAIEGNLPSESPEPRPVWDRRTELPFILRSRHAGVIQYVSADKIVRLARQYDVVVELMRPVGSFVPLDTPLLRTSRSLGDKEKSELLSHVTIGTERTVDQDIGFGFRELTDIALRALSPAMNDATTAINVIDAEHDLLLRIGKRADPVDVHADEDGEPRLLVVSREWEDYLSMTLGEIAVAGAGYARVEQRLAEMVADLEQELPSERASVARQVASGHARVTVS